MWINPYIAQESKLYDEGAKAGYFIKKSDGSVWQFDWWQAGMAFVDFTNPEAYKWYQTKLKALMDMGVDVFKTDFGERIPTGNTVYHDGSNPEKLHNFYAFLYNKCTFEIIEKTLGKALGDAERGPEGHGLVPRVRPAGKLLQRVWKWQRVLLAVAVAVSCARITT